MSERLVVTDILAAQRVPRARVHELLVKAREHLLERGWATNWVTEQGNVCIMGAIGLARGASIYAPSSSLRAAAFTPEGWACALALRPLDPERVINWNDHANREIVMARLEQAIENTAPEVEAVEEERELALA